MKRTEVCIIGAGAAGLASAHALSKARVGFDCFEAGSQIGGLWRYGNDSGSSVYASLITNTSAMAMKWFGYAMPNHTNKYLTHEEVLEYLTNFARDTEVAKTITCSTRVTNVEPQPHGGFRVVSENRSGERVEREYRAVVVATGCHTTPKWPKIVGNFTGQTLHACEYRTPEIFLGKRIIVAGLGASGADIACDAADTAESVVLSTRTGGYLLPRYVDGRPRDEGNRAWVSHLPRALRKQLWQLSLVQRPLSAKVRTALERHASPFAKPAVMNDRLAALIDHDAVVVKPGIRVLDGNRAVFSDRSSAECDLLVCATGYETNYPFFASEIAEQNGWFRDRFLRVIPPKQPDLYFVGKVSVVGPFFPVLQNQALWVADLLAGRCTLPSQAELERSASRESRQSSSIYGDAGRREDVIEYHPYLRALHREHKAGLARHPRNSGVAANVAVALDPDYSS